MIRTARAEETMDLAELVYIILQDMELPIIENMPKNELLRLLSEAMQEETYRYSFRNGLVCERDGQIAGVAFGYKGELEPVIDRPLMRIAQKYGYGDSFQVFIDSETQPGEWYLDSIVTHPDFRRQGVATELLETVPEWASRQGETVIGLNCDQQNLSARQLYERQGFVKAGERRLASHMYDHMQKKIQ